MTESSRLQRDVECVKSIAGIYRKLAMGGYTLANRFKDTDLEAKAFVELAMKLIPQARDISNAVSGNAYEDIKTFSDKAEEAFASPSSERRKLDAALQASISDKQPPTLPISRIEKGESSRSAQGSNNAARAQGHARTSDMGDDRTVRSYRPATGTRKEHDVIHIKSELDMDEGDEELLIPTDVDDEDGDE
ncbi:MAG: hypothetical protein M1833_001365 [Piccolia ochrophora]|nr:MAG: hypothetical protein M1833_001365 [Piccolia ochrophora]